MRTPQGDDLLTKTCRFAPRRCLASRAEEPVRQLRQLPPTSRRQRASRAGGRSLSRQARRPGSQPRNLATRETPHGRSARKERSPPRRSQQSREKGGVRNSRQDPRAHQQAIVRRERGQSMPDNKDRAKLQKRPLARLRRRDGDNRWAAHGDAERINADEQAGLRNADPEAFRDIRQQSDDRKFGRADCESSKEESKE